MGDAVVGIVANPLAGRDIRRLVTQASVFPTAEKANMIQRMLTAFDAVGVHRVLLSTDLGGISASVFRAIERRRGQDGQWPEVEFLDGQPIRQTAQDTVDAVRRMVTAGARVIVCLGGDGTARVTASASGRCAHAGAVHGDQQRVSGGQGGDDRWPGGGAGRHRRGTGRRRGNPRQAARGAGRRPGRDSAHRRRCVHAAPRGDPRGMGSGNGDPALLRVRRTRRDRPVQHPGPAVPRRPARTTRGHRPHRGAKRQHRSSPPSHPGWSCRWACATSS